MTMSECEDKHRGVIVIIFVEDMGSMGDVEDKEATKFSLERTIIDAPSNDSYSPLHDLRQYFGIGLCVGQQVVTSGCFTLASSSSLLLIHTGWIPPALDVYDDTRVVSTSLSTYGIGASHFVPPFFFLWTIMWSLSVLAEPQSGYYVTRSWQTRVEFRVMDDCKYTPISARPEGHRVQSGSSQVHLSFIHQLSSSTLKIL
ncbi:hypothetical protein EDD17DRAFT_1511810 [Pisolithus thermaeus]|nr:hypothetical protein EDD17DRAFT_1511810 [Pisolithus thermaeus]